MIRTIQLHDLVALNDEILALVRAGVPLDQGLLQLGHDLPGRLGSATQRIGQRLEQGESLEKIIASEEMNFPAVYQAIVRAGMQSGRLAGALESLAHTSRRVMESRRAVFIAMIYPLVVLSLGYALLLMAVLHWVPLMAQTYERMGFEPTFLLRALLWTHEHAWWWAPWPPVVAIAIGLRWWFRARDLSLQNSSRLGRTWIRWRSAIMATRLATFSEVLALLVEHHVPLHEAVVLAADTSGEPSLMHDARLVSEQLREGQRSIPLPSSLPPLIGYLILTPHDQQALRSGLAHAASVYRGEADQRVEWLSTYMPILLTLALGGLLALLYTFVLLGPWYQMLYRLG